MPTPTSITCKIGVKLTVIRTGEGASEADGRKFSSRLSNDKRIVCLDLCYAQRLVVDILFVHNAKAIV